MEQSTGSDPGRFEESHNSKCYGQPAKFGPEPCAVLSYSVIFDFL